MAARARVWKALAKMVLETLSKASEPVTGITKFTLSRVRVGQTTPPQPHLGRPRFNLLISATNKILLDHLLWLRVVAAFLGPEELSSPSPFL